MPRREIDAGRDETGPVDDDLATVSIANDALAGNLCQVGWHRQRKPEDLRGSDSSLGNGMFRGLLEFSGETQNVICPACP